MSWSPLFNLAFGVLMILAPLAAWAIETVANRWAQWRSGAGSVRVDTRRA